MLKEDSIEKVEREFGVRFPSDFVCYIKKYNGGYPTSNILIVDGREEMINNFLSFNEDDITYVVEHYEDIKEYMPEDIYPFARDAADNLICFDFSSSNVSVVFWDYEVAYKDKLFACTFIAKSFTELIDKLR